MTFKQRYYSLSLSLALHLGLAALLLCSYMTPKQAPLVGVNADMSVHSYIASQTPLPANPAPPTTVVSKPTPAPRIASNNNMVDDAETEEEGEITLNQASSNAPPPTATPAASSGDHQDALLTLLHNAILAKQHYPHSALTMKRHGTVQVGFLLSPDGTARDIQLMHSSGTDSLDQAALQAIQDASPFHGVAAYVTQDKHFNLDVVFTLPA